MQGVSDNYTNDFGVYRSENSRLNVSGISATGTGFREKILAKLGNAQLEDSMVVSQPEDYANTNFLSGQKIQEVDERQIVKEQTQYVDQYDDSDF